VLAVVGATGTGKSALADALAVYLGGEVVNADSMQVYRGMDIGTAKVPLSERGVPYHGIDLVDPNFPFTAALYQREARAAIESIRERDTTPVLCGGTGLYARVALDNFHFDEAWEEKLVFEQPKQKDSTLVSSEKGEKASSCVATSEAPNASLALRSRFTTQADELGAEAFHDLLAKRDPQSAALIHPHNVRRVIRAFELLEQGISYAARNEGFTDFAAVYPTQFIGLTAESEVLYEVIERRVDSMMASGLLEEVRGLVDAGFCEALCARQAIGYKELVPVLEGVCLAQTATAQIKQATRRYAKRQRTWFRRDSRIEWIDTTDLHRLVLAGSITRGDFTRQLRERALKLIWHPCT
jgi:tRNA dimethylallyltransferase